MGFPIYSSGIVTYFSCQSSKNVEPMLLLLEEELPVVKILIGVNDEGLVSVVETSTWRVVPVYCCAATPKIICSL